MATLVLGAVGTLVAGPFGGAIGALAGRQIDSRIVGSPTREGPRLQDLKASTSSYGQPIAVHSGRVRVGGTIVWSSDLVEESDTSGGGKGSARTKTYSYSISFAVLLASHPIDGVGRIWADGNLLRGAAGDLKTGGAFRFHSGHADQQPDPLLAAVHGSRCPAFRGCAYVVFEALDLTDFGNRVPALTFELLAGPADGIFGRIAAPAGMAAEPELAIPGLVGFTHEGGGADAALDLLGKAAPLAVDLDVAPPQARRADIPIEAIPALGPATAWADADFGPDSGSRRSRTGADLGYASLRYYDVDRDYQPGVQHAARRAEPGGGQTLDFPASLNAQAARGIVASLSSRMRRRESTLLYRTCEIDPAVGPGAIVRVPEHEGLWSVEAWEWREGGVELELARFAPAPVAIPASADPGAGWTPPDRPAATMQLRVFELPWDGNGSPDDRQVYAAIGASEGRWAGATLYAERDGGLVPLGISTRQRAITGETASALSASCGVLMESRATLDIRLDHPGMSLASTTVRGLLEGDNRMCVGDELMQFRDAVPLGEGLWRITGLLRARGGTEPAAIRGHSTGTPVVLLDDSLVALSGNATALGTARLAALDNSGPEPVVSAVENYGRTLEPLCPVHPRATVTAEGGMDLRWTRRARGAWTWPGEVDVPLVEQAELYEVGIGDPASPTITRTTIVPWIALGPAILADVPASTPIWVRQVGTHAKSPALLLAKT